MTTIGRAGRGLIAALSLLLLAVLIVTDCGFAPTTRSAPGAGRSAAGPAAEPVQLSERRTVVTDTRRLPHPASEDCEGRRPGGSPVTAPVPRGTPLCVGDADADPARPPAGHGVRRTGHHTVPVSRSSDLPVALQIFRC
ncbi:hypothetical protein LRS74_14335 [Streptomyces sp. LX-29]|uniref:hypothetical protein n=1 Tax=Streptomyces sp. LX-29 TaxID=2900152 RepID=UPI00240CF0A5|nr:hypothetical protein [Streptomyces sp. LX-29]WFB08099.1 hypothetical protein LRS74_14335 [Streptomyces sp. LX-29]